MGKRVTRRDFIVFVSGTAGALIAGCRPVGEGAALPAATPAATPAAIPTLVPEGFSATAAPTQAATTEGAQDIGERTEAADFSAADPVYGAVTFDKEIQVTPVERFYVQSWDLLPEPVDAASWTLTINGLVEQPMTLTYEDVRRFEPVTVMRTLECIGNPVGGPLIGNTTWTGFRLKPLLEAAGIRREAIRAKFSAADRYKTSVEIEWILQEDTLMVYEMDGKPLTNEHGSPLRIMMPGLYGQKMPKWITGIEFVDDEAQGYYEYHGWSDRAEVKTNSQISLPENFATITGTFTLQGWAYAGKRRITAVEISVDGGAWQPCDLLHGPSPLVWTQWWTQWAPSRTGAFTVAVRATDDTGFTQSEPGTMMDSAYPDGTDRIHSLAYHAQKPEDGTQ